MGKENRIWTLLCFPCCGGYKGAKRGFYLCGCRLYDPDDFCTKDGCINCLLSQGSRAAILYAIQPETFENATGGTLLGNSSAYAMAIYFSFISDTSTCYGDITMARDPPNGRVALFFLASIGMMVIGLGVGAVANAFLQCLNNEPRTGFKTLDRVIKFITNWKILAMITIYLGFLTVGAAIFMWLPYVENVDYPNTTAMGHGSNWGYDEAFYWGWVSFTTCGYGDITMQSVTGRILQIFWATFAIGFFGSSVSLTVIWFEAHFDRILHKRLSSKLVSKTGQTAEKWVEELMEKITKDFPKKENRKEVFQLIRDAIGEQLDNMHTHSGLQGKFSPAHGAERRRGGVAGESESEELVDM